MDRHHEPGLFLDHDLDGEVIAAQRRALRDDIEGVELHFHGVPLA